MPAALTNARLKYYIMLACNILSNNVFIVNFHANISEFCSFLPCFQKDNIYQGKEDMRTRKNQIYCPVYSKGTDFCHKGKEDKCI